MFEIKLVTFYDGWAEIDWSDSQEYLVDAVTQANAIRNRMTAPQLGTWEIIIIDETGGREVIAASGVPESRVRLFVRTAEPTNLDSADGK